MKNKEKLTIIIIVTLIIAIIGLLILSMHNDKKNNKTKDLLAIKMYLLDGWGQDYYGTAIFDDGTIYMWNYIEKIDGSFDEYIEDTSTKSGMKKFILDNGIKKIRKVSKKDLNELKKYINNLTAEDVDYPQTFCDDCGEESILVYKDNKEYILSIANTDYTMGESKTENVQTTEKN